MCELIDRDRRQNFTFSESLLDRQHCRSLLIQCRFIPKLCPCPLCPPDYFWTSVLHSVPVMWSLTPFVIAPHLKPNHPILQVPRAFCSTYCNSQTCISCTWCQYVVQWIHAAGAPIVCLLKVLRRLRTALVNTVTCFEKLTARLGPDSESATTGVALEGVTARSGTLVVCLVSGSVCWLYALSESAHIAWCYGYEPERDYRAVAQRQCLSRPQGCSGLRNPVLEHILPSGTLCFFHARGYLCLVSRDNSQRNNLSRYYWTAWSHRESWCTRTQQ